MNKENTKQTTEKEEEKTKRENAVPDAKLVFRLFALPFFFAPPLVVALSNNLKKIRPDPVSLKCRIVCVSGFGSQ